MYIKCNVFLVWIFIKRNSNERERDRGRFLTTSDGISKPQEHNPASRSPAFKYTCTQRENRAQGYGPDSSTQPWNARCPQLGHTVLLHFLEGEGFLLPFPDPLQSMEEKCCPTYFFQPIELGAGSIVKTSIIQKFKAHWKCSDERNEILIQIV